MKYGHGLKRFAGLVGALTIAFGTMGFWGAGDQKGIPPKDVADMLHTVMNSDRTV